MGIWREHYHCVDLISEKVDEPFATRHGAAYHCHELNANNPNERWTVRSFGQKYVPDYYEAAKMSRKMEKELQRPVYQGYRTNGEKE